MSTQCLKLAAANIPRQKEGAKFLSPPYLMPIFKGLRPFMCWCIDTIVRLHPPAPNGARDVVVCICPCSRWIEIGALPSLNSHEVAKWFHTEIVCRYGLPLIVCSDKGSEYKGAFD